jgi:hypothetical protein
MKQKSGGLLKDQQIHHYLTFALIGGKSTVFF